MAQGLVVDAADVVPTPKALVVESKDVTTSGAPAAPPHTSSVDPRITKPDSTKPAHISSDTPLQRFWRAAYAELPLIGATTGAALASAPFVLGGPATLGASELAAPTALVAGAGAGGAVGHWIQRFIDQFTGGATQVKGSAGSEATRQMELQMGSEATAGAVGAGTRAVLDKTGLSKGVFRPAAGSTAEEALRTNAEHGLGLSTPEITGGPTGRMAQYAGTRAVTGQVIQAKVRQAGNESAAKAVGRLLDEIGPSTTEVGAGEAAQRTLQTAAGKAGKRLEGAIATKLAPDTGTAASGRTAAEGVLAARKGFAEVQRQYAQILKDSPALDMGPFKQKAWSIFREQVLPVLQSFPALGPNTKAYQQLQELGLKEQYTEVGPQLAKVLESDAIKKLNSPILRTLRRVLTSNQIVPFADAANFRTILRQSGKAPDELLADQAKGVATALATDLRKIMAEASPAWDAAAGAYGPDARMFQTRFVRNLIAKDPETVLAGLGGAQGRVLSTRVNSLRKLLLGVAAKGTPEETAKGIEAWNTLRAGWLRREVFQQDPFGMTERLRAVDPDVLRSWFPDAAGKDVVKRATDIAGQYESQIVKDLVTKDPANVLAHVGSTPQRITDTRNVLLAHPEADGPASWQRLQRAKVQQLVGDDPGTMINRIEGLDKDEKAAWFPAEAGKDRQHTDVLEDLSKIGRALGRRITTPQSSIYKAIEFAHVGGDIMRGSIVPAMAAAGLYEGMPGLITWAIYNPSLRKMLVTGIEAKDPKLASALLFRVLDAYKQAHQPNTAQPARGAQ